MPTINPSIDGARLQSQITTLQNAVAGKASSSDLEAAAATNLAQMRSEMPVPATTDPPPAAPASAKGGSGKFARADHTHAERVKWVGVDQQSSIAGAWSLQLPANRFINKPAVFVTVTSPTHAVLDTKMITGSASAGFTITLNFKRKKDTLTVPLPAVVIGASATNVNVSVNETSVGVVTFDIACGESDT